MPSVTTVLSATETEKSKAGLRTWQKNNPGALEEASKRGSAIHKCCEDYIRGLPIDCPPEYSGFWSGISTYLDWFDTIHWSERPLRKDWYHLRSDDKEVAYVWSTEHLYAGCPDLIGEIGGVRVIADFKTSNAPYSNCFPDRGIALALAASGNIKSVLSKWLRIAWLLKRELDIAVTLP